MSRAIGSGIDDSASALRRAPPSRETSSRRRRGDARRARARTVARRTRARAIGRRARRASVRTAVSIGAATRARARGVARGTLEGARGGMMATLAPMPVVPIAYARAPAHATRFVAVDGLGLVAVLSTARDADSIVRVAEIVSDEMRETLVAIREEAMRAMRKRVIAMRAAMEASRVAEDVVRWSAGSAQTRVGKSTRRWATRRSSSKRSSPKKNSESLSHRTTHGCSSSPSAGTSSPDTAPPSPSTLPRPSFADSAAEEEYPALPTPLPPIPSIALTPSQNTLPLPPQEWIDIAMKPKHTAKGKGRRFIRRRVERVEKAHWDLTLFMSRSHEALDARCENTTHALRDIIRQYQRNRLDHDVGLETHKDVLHSVIDHPNSPMYHSCACEEALKLHTDIDGIVGYDFFAETCSCEDCLKMYVYLLCDRQCVCPKCFNEATKEGHERAETARRLFASSDDTTNVPEKWSDIATHFGRLSSQRTLRHIEELLQRLRKPVLALPPTPPSRRRKKPPPKIELHLDCATKPLDPSPPPSPSAA
jgi:hypothetical protein